MLTRRRRVIDILSPLKVALSHGPELSFLVLLQTLIVLYRPDISDKENRVRPVLPSQIQETYDYVIVGAGSAGSVVANRLSEIGNWTVLLLEAGGDEPELSDVPFAYQILQNTPIDWQFRTEPSDRYCLAMNDHRCFWPRGKALGGCSVLNAMLYVRGNRKDYDQWAAAGNPGWDYGSVLPYFKKSEGMRIAELQRSPYHETGGYLTVEHFKFRAPITKYMVRAAEQLGMRQTDINGAYQTGVTYSPGTLRNGLRGSTAKSFLRPIWRRPNLDISTKSIVHKILIDEYTNSAYGVQFRTGSSMRTVLARREVILSAGALQSPQLLMLSGIGPRQHLEQMGIKVIHHSPGVGENLQDHVAMGGLIYLVDPPENYATGLYLPLGQPPLFTYIIEDAATPSTIKQFISEYDGPLYGLPFAEAMTFNSSKYQNPADDFPDIQIFWAAGTEASDAGLSQRSFNLRQDVSDSLYKDILFHNGYQGTPLLLRPRSRGYVKLRSKDPEELPMCIPNYFSDPHDIKVLIEGAKMIHLLKDAPIMREINARTNPNKIPGCEQYERESDDYLKCHARHYTMTIYHQCGTCKMGPANDPMAVVDTRLRVYGIRNLRVVDASIMPTIPSGNTNAPTIMIAEKAADMIKEDAIRQSEIIDSHTDSSIASKQFEATTKKEEVGLLDGLDPFLG